MQNMENPPPGGFGGQDFSYSKGSQPGVQPQGSLNVSTVTDPLSGRIGDLTGTQEMTRQQQTSNQNMRRGGAVKKMAQGGLVKSSASRRGDGCATKGKTKGRFV
jgi:hypothetical protein